MFGMLQSWESCLIRRCVDEELVAAKGENEC